MNESKEIQSILIRSNKSITREEIQTWLINYLAELFEIEPSEVDLLTPFTGYGLDSAATVVMVSDLEHWLGCRLPESILFDHSTIEKLSLHLAK